MEFIPAVYRDPLAPIDVLALTDTLKTDWWQTNGTLMRAFSYTLGAGGVRVAVNESDPTNSNRRSISWQYDVNGTNQFARLYRLTSETITNLGSLGTEQHVYDLVGNRLSRSVTGFITNSVTNSAWTDNARDELVGDTYDGAGNTTLGTSLSLTNPDSYDAENHLILRGTNTAPVVQIDYDAFGNRVKKTAGGTTTWYLVDDQSPSGYQQVVAEFNSLSSAPLRTYAYGLSLIDIVSSGTTSYALTDGQGSVRALFSDTAAASLTDNYDFDAYGVLTTSTGSTVNNYRYTGQQWDPDLQLYYLRARYYAPTLGRFWSSDSFEGRKNEPGSLHKYLYCDGNPVNMRDPSGHEGLAELNVATFISVVINGYSAYKNIQAKRYAWAAVDILSMGFGIGGMAGPGLFGQLATAEGIVANAAQFRAGIQGAQQVCQAWALVGLIMMMSQNGASSSGLPGGSQGDLKPVVPNSIPATTEASVIDKLQRYLLNPNHIRGGDKAEWFRQALGFDLKNTGDLAKQIVFDEKAARATQLTQYGQKYEQTIKITEANGRTIDVLWVWIKNNDGVVRLVTWGGD